MRLLLTCLLTTAVLCSCGSPKPSTGSTENASQRVDSVTVKPLEVIVLNDTLTGIQ